jgi:hypothetical protein
MLSECLLMSKDNGRIPYPGSTNATSMPHDNFVVIEPSVGAIQDEIYGLEQLVEQYGAANVVDVLAKNIGYLQVKMESAAINLPEPLERRLAQLQEIVKKRRG